VKEPSWLAEQIAVEGRRVLAGDVTEDEAVASLTEQLLAREPRYVRSLVIRAILKALRAWRDERRRAAEAAAAGQLLLFADLPEALEVAPGRFVAQRAMRRRDWTAALVQARTKAANAAGYVEKLEAAYGLVEHLLTDDELTTAEALGRAA
jgi:hypothetical protein